MEIKTNNNIVYSCKYHVVWCPKYRRKVLVGAVEQRLKELLQEVCDSRKAEIIELEIMPDHVHLLVEVDPQFGIHRLIKEIKGTTSRILRQEFKHLTTKLPTLWTNSYFVATVGCAPLSAIKQYIENQKRSQREQVMITYCYKLYRAKRNKKLHKAINIAGCIYNHCIALHRRYYRLYGKHLSANKLKMHITKLKKTKKYSYWNQLGSQAIQDIVERIDRGYKLFFRNNKHGIKSSPPSFRKVRKYRSFTLKQAGYKLLDGNRIKIMGNEYKFHKSREVDGIIKTVTVKRDALGDLYIYIVCKQEKTEVKPRSGKSVGFDFGLITFLTSSDGKDVEAPLFFKENSSKIKKLNRKLSRKKKGSNNRKLARLDLARLHKKVSNQRKDYHFKLAKKLAEEYAVICIEDLNIKAMQQLWGRKISDLGHSQFVGILKHQCAKTGCKVVEIPRFYPSSKTCSDCGYVNSTLSLSERTWTCPECGVIHDRDKNAAVNIHRVGASTLVGEGVRPALAGILQ